MKTKILAIVALTLFTMTSCKNADSPTTDTNSESINSESFSLIGKTGKLTFPESTAEVNYLTEDSLHWKFTDNKGVVTKGVEKLYYERLTENKHFLNWIEQDGWTVSQIIDTKEGTVKAFWSFADESSTRGKRASMFVDGKFEFVK